MQNSLGQAISPFTCATFTPFIGERFSITVMDDESVDFELVSAELAKLKPIDGRALGKAGTVRLDPFALIFRGPVDKVFAQGIYTFHHATLGDFSMSIVPVGPGESGLLYEAVFN